MSMNDTCANQTVETCTNETSQCSSYTTVSQHGKSSLIDSNVLLYLTDGEAGIIYWCWHSGNVTCHTVT